jgi:hypothetical protein
MRMEKALWKIILARLTDEKTLNYLADQAGEWLITKALETKAPWDDEFARAVPAVLKDVIRIALPYLKK